MVLIAPQGGWTRLGELFADARHYRGDCRMLASAIRRGWTDALTDGERADLVTRFQHATAQREADAALSDNARLRGIVASIRWMLAIDRRETDDARRERQRTWPRPRPLNGRPRERLHVGDFGHRIDAAALRRQYFNAGGDPAGIEAVDLQTGDQLHRVRLVTVASPDFAPRWMVVCPRCNARRRHLYATRGGLGCRRCLRMASAKAHEPTVSCILR